MIHTSRILSNLHVMYHLMIRDVRCTVRKGQKTKLVLTHKVPEVQDHSVNSRECVGFSYTFSGEHRICFLRWFLIKQHIVSDYICSSEK